MPPRLNASLLAALLCAAPPVCAEGPGTTGAEFLRVDVGARAVGMGGAYTGLAEGASSLAYNPAGMALLRRGEFEFSHAQFLSELRHEWVAVAVPMPRGSLGASANLFFTRPFEAYDQFDRPAGSVSAFDAAYQVAYAVPLTRRLAVGGAGKFISSKLFEYAARTYATDAGVVWNPLPGLRLGAAAINMGPGLRYVSVEEPLPLTVRAGASLTPFDPRFFNHYFTVAADVVKARNESASVRFGGEYWYDYQVALRGGIAAEASGPGWSLGLGLRFFRDERLPVGVGFDYAFTNAGDLGHLHRGSLSMRFGRAKTPEAIWRARRERSTDERRRPEPEEERREPARREPQRRPAEGPPADLENWIRP